MKPTTLKERYSLLEDAIFEESSAETNDMTDEELKIEALKIATNIGKLMSNVTTDDIVSIAETVAKFIKSGGSSELETVAADNSGDTSDDTETTDNTSDESEEDFTTDDTETQNESETSEDFDI